MNNLKTALTTSLNNDERYELKNSYYGITDNLPGAIEALTLAYENACRDKAPSTTRAALAVELDTFKRIQKLMEQTRLGAIL